jgi:hypothetical protein
LDYCRCSALQGMNKECDHDTAWETHFQQLVEYKLAHGDCNVPLEYSHHPDLGKWLKNQRRSHQKGQLKDERKNRLNGIGVVWSESELNWELRFQQLLAYKKTQGDCNVPRSFFNAKLGHWVMHQRQSRRNMRKDRKHRLDSIGFIWGRRYVDWYTRYQELVQYKGAHGNCEVPYHSGEPNKELGHWVVKQRYLEGKHLLRKDRIAKLDSVGFRFGQAKESDDWDGFFEELRDYLRNHGDCNVPEEYRVNPSLGDWVKTQRYDYAMKFGRYQSAMTAEREAKLNVLGFSWVKTQAPSPAPASNDKVTIATEVRSNDSSWRDGGYEGETSSTAAGFKKRKAGHPAAIANDESFTSGQGSLDIIVNTAVLKWLGDNDAVCTNGRSTH